MPRRKLPQVTADILLVVGGDDAEAIPMNESAAANLTGAKHERKASFVGKGIQLYGNIPHVMADKTAKLTSAMQRSQDRPWVLILAINRVLLTGSMLIFWAVFQGFVVKRMGGQYLPYFFLFVAIAAIISAVISLRVLRNWSPARQGSLYLFLGAPAAVFLAWSQAGLTADSPLVLQLAFIGIGAGVIAALVQPPLDKLKVVLSDAMPAERLQRIETRVSSYAQISIVVTGLFLAFLGEKVGSGFMFWLAAFLAVFTFPFYVLLAHKARETSVFMPPARAEGKTSKFRILPAFEPGPARRAVLLLAALTGLSVIFGSIFSYEFILATNDHFPLESQISAFIGGYYALAGLTMAAFVTGARRYLLKRFGLTRILHVPTLLVALGVLAVFTFPIFALVIAVVFMRDIIMSVQGYGFTVMLQSVSDGRRNQAWSWLDGPVLAFTGVIGSLLLLAFPPGFWGGPYGAIRTLSILVLGLLLVRLIITRKLEGLFPLMLEEGLRKGDFKTRIRSIDLMDELRFVKHRRLGAMLDVARDEAEPTAVRLSALKTLGGVADPTSLRVIAKMVAHPEPNIRREAIRAISKFDFRLEETYQSGFSRKMLIRRLREVFRKETDVDSVKVILDALIALRDDDVVPLLTECLQGDDLRLKRSCLMSLRKFSDAGVIDEVRELLDDPDPSIRSEAIAALWQFPWERPDKLLHRLEKLVGSDPKSDEYYWGAYLIGELQLVGYRSRLKETMSVERSDTRLQVSISLLRLGDLAGITVAEEVLTKGDGSEASKIVRLAKDPEVPEQARQALEAAVHRHHLHYPPELPVTEPLRRRLANIPTRNLQALLSYYPSPVCDTDRAKLETTDGDVKGKTVGHVALYGLDDPWLTMAAVHLLAWGYQIRVIGDPIEAQADETVVADETRVQPPPGAIALSDREGEHRVIKSHFAPSELRRAIEQLKMSQYL